MLKILTQRFTTWFKGTLFSNVLVFYVQEIILQGEFLKRETIKLNSVSQPVVLLPLVVLEVMSGGTHGTPRLLPLGSEVNSATGQATVESSVGWAPACAFHALKKALLFILSLLLALAALCLACQSSYQPITSSGASRGWTMQNGTMWDKLWETPPYIYKNIQCSETPRSVPGLHPLINLSLICFLQLFEQEAIYFQCMEPLLKIYIHLSFHLRFLPENDSHLGKIYNLARKWITYICLHIPAWDGRCRCKLLLPWLSVVG